MFRLSVLISALAAAGASAPLCAQDTTPPVAAVVSPADGSYLNTLPSIDGTAADDVAVADAQLKVVRQSDGYFWDGAAFVSGETWLTAPFTDPAWAYAAPPAWANGESYSAIARASDTSGNWTADYSTSVFHFDTGLPVSSVTAPANGSAPAIFSGISGTAADTEFFIAQVWVKLIRASDNMYWNGGTSQWTVPEAWNLAAGTATWSWAGPTQAALTVGATYFAVASAVDLAGNPQGDEVGSSTFVYAGAPLPPGCAAAVSVKNGGSGNYTFIQDAVDALPNTLTGDTCVVVTNDGSYSEEVTVQGFTTNGYRLIIMREPAGGSPQVSPPPSSTAAFRIMNASVTLAGFDAIPGGVMPYGVYASSDNVILSSISVVSAGSINLAGIRLASWSEVSDSAVVTEFSHGIQLTGDFNRVVRSSASNNDAAYDALSLSGVSGNTISDGYFLNSEGKAVGLDNGASNNDLLRVTAVSEGAAGAALHLSNASSNTITETAARNDYGSAARFYNNSNYNSISYSTFTSDGGDSSAVYLTSASFNTISDTLIVHVGSGSCVYLEYGASGNSIARSTATTTATTPGYIRFALYLSNNSSSNTVTDSVLAAPNGITAGIYSGSDFNVLLRDTLFGGSTFTSGLYIYDSSFNGVSESVINNPLGEAVLMDRYSAYNSITYSTITSNAVFAAAVHFEKDYANTLSDSYVQGGSTAVFVGGSTNTVISDSVLVSTWPYGIGLESSASRDFSLYSSTVSGGSLGSAVYLATGNLGGFNISSATVSSGAHGLRVAAQGDGASLNFHNINFQGLAAGATAVQFLGGTPVATFTAFGFGDANIAVNVDGALLAAGARLTMRDYSGPRAGPLYENDPSGYIDWFGADITAPTAAVLQPVNNAFLTSLSLLSGTAADNVAVGSVTVSVLRNDTGLYWDGSAWAAPQAWLDASIWPSSWTYTSVPAWVDGSSYTIAARAMDSSNNWTVAYSTAVFTYDITAPAAAITAPVTGTYASFTSVDGTASDPFGVAQVQVSVLRESDGQYWDGAAWAAGPLWNASTGTATWNYNGITAAALDSGATYLFTLRAYDTAGNMSGEVPGSSTFTYVLPAAGVLSPAAFGELGVSSLTVNWGTTFSPGTLYYTRLSTLAAASPYLFAGSTTTAFIGFSGLDPDTGYYGFVSTSPAAGFLASGAGRTLAAAPAPPVFSGVGYTGLTMTWSGGSNPAWTVYEYEISESDIFGVFASSGSGAVLTAAFTGLTQGTTYYGRVRAVNADAVPTAYAEAALPAVTQVLLPAGQVTGLTGAALGVSSINWTWYSGTVTMADYYALYDGPGAALSTMSFAASAAYAQTGLGPNSAHLLRVAGGNAMGEGALAASATVYTLALTPSDPTAPQVALTSADITLGLNGNPAGTELQLWRSADNVSFSSVYDGAALSYTDAALAECSAYYYKARARNGAGLYSGFTNALSFTTLASTPAAPGGLYAEALDGARIALVWEPSPSVSVSGYNLYYDNASGTVDYALPFAVFSSTVAAWTTQALAAGSTYKFAVRAVSACGIEEKNTALLASAQAAGVLSGVRAAIKVPQTGKRVTGNMVTIVAEVVLGLPSQVAQVRFQYSPAGAGAWTDITAANANNPNPDYGAPYFVHMSADALAPGAYDLRAVATDVYGISDPAAPSVTIVVDAVNYDISETVSGGEQRKEQKINNTVTSTVQAGDDVSALVTKVIIPSGAVTDSTAAVTLVSNPAAVPAPPAGADSLNLAIKVNLSNGQSQLAGGQTAALTFSYQDDDGNGIVDGTLAAVDRLRVYSAADAGGAWTQLVTSVDREKKTVTAVTPHFSFFSVFAAAASGLNALKVYPVPWQPGTGGRFDAQGVTFSGLPASARIRIYTLIGELVRLLEVTSADAGFKVWDGRNSEGHKAASGIYIALVKAGSDERTVKVAVER